MGRTLHEVGAKSGKAPQGEQGRMRAVERWAAGLSLVGGGIHALAGPDHFSEWWGYGLFFVAASAAQLLFGLLLVTHGISRESGWTWEQVRRRVYAVGIVGNVAIVLLWAVTRTVGIPTGPLAGTVEDVGTLDAASKIAEAVLIGLLAWLWLRSGPAPAGAPDG